MKKRVFSLILALIFSISLLPAAAFAEGAESGAAQIGEKTYSTLPDALNAAQDGDTVKLLADYKTAEGAGEEEESGLTITKSVTLDLNGHKMDDFRVAQVDEETNEVLTSGNLTVEDTSKEKSGTVSGMIELLVGNLTINGGAIGDGRDGVRIEKGNLTVNGGTIDFLYGSDSGMVTITGGTVKNAQFAEGFEITVTGGSGHTGLWNVMEGTWSISDGEFEGVTFLTESQAENLHITGGTFGKITRQILRNGIEELAPISGLLADGYAFYQKTDSGEYDRYVNLADKTSLENVQVKQHTHNFTGNNNVCTECGKQFAASITEGNDVTYYDRFNDALVYAYKNDGCTLKLLADVTGTAVMINNPFLFDLNGHNVDALSVDARATIKDSGTKKGKIGKVTVSDEKVPGLTLGGLLEEGYAFKYETGYWANDSHLRTSDGLSVTVEKAPIQSVAVYAKDKNNKKVSTIAYGTTGDVTLVASCKLSETSGEKLSCAWYKLTDDAAIPPLDGATGTSYTLPADLSVGEHRYLVTFTADDYSKSDEITITVTKIDLANAEVTISPWPTDRTVRYDPFYPEQSVFNIYANTITVKANGTEYTLSNDDYTYTGATATRVGNYKLTITAKDSCANYKGSKTFDWEVTPCQLYNPNYLGNQKYTKIYDGTTTLPKEYHFYASFRYEGVKDNVDWLDDTSKSNYEVTAAEFVSPDVGENKPINQTITLKNENFVFAPTEIIKIKGITTTDKTMTYTNFTTKEGYGRADTTFNIEKATVPDFDKAVTLEVINDLENTYTIDLPDLPALESPRTYGEITYGRPSVLLDSSYYTAGNAKVENGKLILTIDKNPVTTTGSIGTVTVKVSSTNYHDFTLTVNVNAANKSGSYSGDSNPTVKSETTTNPDGSVTKTEIKADGTVIETTTKKDGSVTKTETKKDGTVIETTTKPDGSVIKTETKPDGSSVTETRTPDGSTGTVKTDVNGKTEASVNVSSSAVEEAKATGNAVQIPAVVAASRDSSTAPAVKINLPANAGETKVEIPVSNVNSGTVAVLVHPDGTEEIVKSSIPTETGIQLTVTGSTTLKIIDNTKPFQDINGHWAENSINFVGARELFMGTGTNTFSPNIDMSRAQLWTVLARQENADLSGGSKWYEKSQLWAVDKGISDGTNPQDPISRAQMISMLWRTAGSPGTTDSPWFTDVPADAYYTDAVAWAAKNNITSGVGNGKFDPNAACTRAQVATFLRNAYENDIF